MQTLIPKIRAAALRGDDTVAYTDLLAVIRETSSTDLASALAYGRQLSSDLEAAIRRRDGEHVRRLYDLHRRALHFLAPHDLDAYIRYVEWNREPQKRFYEPRRRVLRQVVDALQTLEDDRLDLLGISMPPGVGKTTVALFYLTWIAGRHSDEPSLVGSHSNAFVRSVYDECLRMMDASGEYLWGDVFPGLAISNTNAKDCRIDVGDRKRFETLEFTSIGTGNAGLYRASRLLYCDDLISGIEVALSKERLDKLWEIYTTDLRQRKIGDHCKELHIATRWSVHDIIGRLEREYENSDRARFIVIPALDEDDRSNFHYAYGVGFSTEFYHEQRKIMDDVSWDCLYQNTPRERNGLLYPDAELRRYFELPDTEPDGIYAVCDTKDKGSDYCVMPIAYRYGNDFYIDAIVCDNSAPDIVEPRLIAALNQHKVHLARFESNSAGGRIAEKVQQGVKDKDGRTRITTKFSRTNKETRIIVASPWVKEHCLFKDKSVIADDKEYRRAMNYLCSYTLSGRNPNDDVPDAMSMLADFVDSLGNGEAAVFKRPF